jgi:DNA replication protein DnaC
VVGKTTGGLVLLGPTGVGKSHLACAVLKAIGVGFRTNEKQVNDEQKAISRKDWEAITDIMEKAISAPLLVLDDLGLTTGELKLEWVREGLYEISNTRYEEELPTITASNTSMRDFKNRYGKRISSRLLSDAVVVNIDDIDHRTGR